MIILISDISSVLSIKPNYAFLNSFPSFQLNSKPSQDIQRSILSLKLLSIGLKDFGINLFHESFLYNQYGKPSLKNRNIHYSISHSGKYIVCAISEKNIGADVQYRIDDFQDVITALNFHEIEWLQSFTNKEELSKEFFNIWTAKESYLKLIGTGLYKNLNSFYVSPGTHQIFDNNLIKELSYRCFALGTKYTLSIVHNQFDKIIFKYVDIDNELIP